MKSIIKWLAIATPVLGMTIHQVLADSESFGSATLDINGIPVSVEFAYTSKMRAQGLMHRDSLCAQCGMYFEFSQPKYAAMWMKNTNIALDVAFVRADGVITDIKPLTPHDLTSVGASEPVLYALEMNQGWFAKHNIKIGDSIVFVSREEK